MQQGGENSGLGSITRSLRNGGSNNIRIPYFITHGTGAVVTKRDELAARYLTEIDRERARLRAMLRSKDITVLAQRPANGNWSIVENIRHLLFAEQLHLGSFLPGGFEWSRVGLTGMTAKKFADVGTRPTNDIEKVFQEWDAVHKPIRKAIKSAEGDTEAALWRNHRHLGIHIRVIERLLRNFPA